ncbi:GntR family transcriptional regulator [Amycolatopsis sp. NPDC059027]|uniref:GntR family transcriptional regulator n=1 Tax=Amycolatopsis sp. NPDC059027 TaxID=3346709 RepID=UPI00366F51CB
MAKTATAKDKTNAAATALRAEIADGTLAPGDWLPSEAQLIARFGVSRYAARQVVARLVTEGLVTSVDGKGTYVRPRRERARHADTRTLTRTPGGFTDADTDAWEQAEKPTTYRTTATEDLALTLGVPEHTPVFVTDRLLTSGDRRMVHRFYVPLATAAQVPAIEADPFRTPGEIYTDLTAAGIDLEWVESVQAAIPAPDDAASLHSTPGAPILVTRRLATDPTGRALAMEETRRSADGVQLTYRITPA